MKTKSITNIGQNKLESKIPLMTSSWTIQGLTTKIIDKLDKFIRLLMLTLLLKSLLPLASLRSKTTLNTDWYRRIRTLIVDYYESPDSPIPVCTCRGRGGTSNLKNLDIFFMALVLRMQIFNTFSNEISNF